MIYTSYFAMVHRVEDKSKLIGIALWPPKGMGDIKCIRQLAPTKEILLRYKHDYDKNAYIVAYKRDVLSQLDVHKVAKYLDGHILLCYEHPEAFCHRHIVAKWLNDNGYACEEINWRNQK